MKNGHILIIFIISIFIFSCKVTPKIALDESGTFYKMLGGALDEKAHDMAEAPDGSFMIAGSTKILVIDETSGSEIEKEITYVAKTDKFGNVIWKKQYPGQAAKAVLQAPDGNWFVGIDSLVVVNSTVSHTDYTLMKIDNNGNPLWTRKYNGAGTRNEVIKKIQIVDNEIYIVGNAVAKLIDETELNAVFIIATNLDGIERTRNEYGSLTIPTANTPADKRPTSANSAIIDPVSSLKYLITMGSTVKQGDDRINSQLIVFSREGIVPIDAGGEFGGGGDDVGESIQLTKDNGYVICGTTNSEGSGGKDMFAIKLTFPRDVNDGKPQAINGTRITWSKTFGGGGDDEGKSIYPTSDGGYLLLGNVATTTAGTDIHLIKLDAFGNQVWEQFFGGTRNDQAKLVKELSNGDILILGTISFENNDMIALIRTNKNGELVK
ncbi:MAG: hypothetical protein MUC49_09935 [Raineya sp.]|nr:hypothetical protein [Raineya sp.]